MALLAISPNVVRSGSNGKLHRKAPSGFNDSLNNGLIPPPTAIQSMLKNNTEVGDLDQSERLTARGPIIDHHPRSSKFRTLSSGSSFSSAALDRQSLRARSTGDFDRRISPVSELSYPSSGRVRFPPHLQKTVSRNPQAGSYNRYASGLTSYRPPRISPRYPPSRLNNHRDVGHVGSVALPKFSTRPYSVTSHVLSMDSLHPGRPRSDRQNTSRDSRYSSTASSRASRAVVRGMLESRRSGNIHSSSRELPQLPRNTTNHNLHPACTIPQVSIRQPASDEQWEDRVRNAEYAGNGAHQHHLTFIHAQPRYYDYSESFVEEDDSVLASSSLHPAQGLDYKWHLLHPSTDPSPRLETRSDRLMGPIPPPIELPTEYNHRPSEHSRNGSHEIAIASNINGQSISRFSEAAEHPVDEGPRLPIAVARKNSCPESISRPFSVSSRRSKAWSTSSIFFLNGEKSQRNLTSFAARLHSPISESRFDSLKACVTGRDHSGTDKRPRSQSVDIAATGQQHFCVENENHQQDMLQPNAKFLSVSASDLQSSIHIPQPQQPVSSHSRKQLRRFLNTKEDNANQMLAFIGEEGISPQASLSLDTNVQAKGGKSIQSYLGDDDPQVLQHFPDDNIDLQDAKTPTHSAQLSVTMSQGKSSVDLLLEKHIESLGLMPETDSSSECTESSDSGNLMTGASCGDEVASREPSYGLHVSRRPEIIFGLTDGTTELSSDVEQGLKPRRLFASMNEKMQATPVPDFQHSIAGLGASSLRHTQLSPGWEVLPSTSELVSSDFSAEQIIMSGEVADIDTDEYALGCRLWTASQLSLPTSFEAVNVVPTRDDEQFHRRSRSVNSAKLLPPNRRHVQILFKNGNQSIIDLNVRKPTTTVDHTTGPCVLKQKDAPSISGRLGLDRDQTLPALSMRDAPKTRDKQSLPRWSSLLAALPMPGTGIPLVRRKASVRTQQSQTSYNSQNSLIEPLNSTRQRSYIPRLGTKIPKLAPPDFGPTLDVSTLNLSIPYAEIPSTIYPSLRETRSFFEESPVQTQFFRRSIKRQFGLRPLRRFSQAGAAPITTNLPMRDGIKMSAVGPSTAMIAHDCSKYNISPFSTKISSNPNFQRKRGKLGRKLKDWWQTQCIQRPLANRKRKGAKHKTPGGLLV